MNVKGRILPTVAVMAGVVALVAVSFYAGFRSGFDTWYLRYGKPFGITKEQAERNVGGGQYYSKTIRLGVHDYVICDYPDARGGRASSLLHAPACPCGKNER